MPQPLRLVRDHLPSVARFSASPFVRYSEIGRSFLEKRVLPCHLDLLFSGLAFDASTVHDYVTTLTGPSS